MRDMPHSLLRESFFGLAVMSFNCLYLSVYICIHIYVYACMCYMCTYKNSYVNIYVWSGELGSERVQVHDLSMR